MPKRASNKPARKGSTLTRRDFLAQSSATESNQPINPEVNAWVVIEPDDTVIIRIAQTELGQGVWTSNAMMVCEELQCDWRKVRPGQRDYPRRRQPANQLSSNYVWPNRPPGRRHPAPESASQEN